MSIRLIVVCLAATTVAACGGSTSSPDTTTGTPISIVNGASGLTSTAYSHNPITIARGTTITWVNNDTTTHDQVADGGAFNTGNVAPGSRASFTFQNAGSFPYHC